MKRETKMKKKEIGVCDRVWVKFEMRKIRTIDVVRESRNAINLSYYYNKKTT